MEKKARKQTLTVIDKILSSTNKRVILRAHPAEDVGIYNQIFGQNNRVFVDKEMRGTPLLMASDSVIHSGSTLGLEAVFLEKKVLSLGNLNGLSGPVMNADLLSFSPSTMDEIVEYIASSNLVGLKPELDNVKKRLIFSPGDLSSVEAISKDFRELMGSKVKVSRSASDYRVKRRVQEIYSRVMGAGLNMSAVSNGKRPIDYILELPSLLKRLSSTTEHNTQFSLLSLHPELYVISQK